MNLHPIEPDTTLPVLLPIKATSRHFGLSISTLRRWLDAKRIESLHVGRSHLIVVASVYAELERLRTA